MFFNAEYALRRVSLAQGRQPGRGGRLRSWENAITTETMLFYHGDSEEKEKTLNRGKARLL